MLRNYLILMVGLVFFCCQPPKELPDPPGPPLPGAYQMTSYLPLLQSKRVAVCTNHTGLIGETHLIDSLMKRGVNVTKVFTPEHGFRGFADAGEHVEYKEQELPFQLVSLYGQHRKPTADDMENLDVVVFDIQDVGARFYTYISTMTYVMEACASSGIPFVVLDRPNPNGSYVDGPVLEAEHKSFVGLHPVPIVHGLTPGEFAQMINGEGWLEGGLRCDLTVISCTDWEHHTRYSLPVRPSPNLPDDHSIALYPSLCLFEQTLCSVGRGTTKAFQHIGHPAYPDTTYFFVPESLPGAMNPRFKGEKCFGVDYATDQPVYAFSVRPLMDFYQQFGESFFKPNFARLAGVSSLEEQIKAGETEVAIRASWEPELTNYKALREKYLLYP